MSFFSATWKTSSLKDAANACLLGDIFTTIVVPRLCFASRPGALIGTNSRNMVFKLQIGFLMVSWCWASVGGQQQYFMSDVCLMTVSWSCDQLEFTNVHEVYRAVLESRVRSFRSRKEMIYVKSYSQIYEDFINETHYVYNKILLTWHRTLATVIRHTYIYFVTYIMEKWWRVVCNALFSPACFSCVQYSLVQ